MNELKCIVCGKELESAMPDEVAEGFSASNQPYGATTFTSHGQYGSTAFDPMDRTFLEVNICDEDLALAAERERVYHVTPAPQRVQYQYVLWTLSSEEQTDD